MDPLCCHEEHWDLDQEHIFPTYDADDDRHCSELLPSLLSKEQRSHLYHLDARRQDPYLGSARREVVGWVSRASARIGFSIATLLLAIDYLDRCFLPWTAGGGGGGGLRLQGDKPWMARLSAVACLSLAAKVEETHVPLLIDLQAIAAAEEGPGSSYLFEPKTVMRMELLVLSALGWRMNPVTPLSFVDLLVSDGKRGGGVVAAGRCDAVLRSVIADWRWVRYPPSVWAAAAMLHAVGHDPEAQHLLALLKAPKEKVEECYQVILECNGGGNGAQHKRKHSFTCPASPNEVIGSCFSCESSSVSSSPEQPPFKRPNCISSEPVTDDGEGDGRWR